MNIKNILSLITAISVTASCGAAAFAADKEKGEPDVIVDGSKIIFADQNAKIVDDVTLVPARGVFEAMDCKVDWDGDKRTVTVTSSTGVKSVLITIDSDIMKISRFKSLFEKETSDYTLEVPAQIINERTMIPLRAVSEAFDCNVEWDDDAYTVNITTGDPVLLDGYTYTAPDKDSLVKMSLSTDKTGPLEAGEEFTVYIEAENVPADSFCSGIVATFEFDKTKFEYIEGSGSMLNDAGETIVPNVSAVENIEHPVGVKVAFATIDSETAAKKSGKVFKAVFKAISGEKSTIGLNYDYDPIFTYGSYLMFTIDHSDTIYKGKNIVIGSPLTIGE